MSEADNDTDAMERTIEGFRGFTYCLEGAEEKGIVYGTGAWNKGEIIGKEAMNAAYQFGLSVH